MVIDKMQLSSLFTEATNTPLNLKEINSLVVAVTIGLVVENGFDKFFGGLGPDDCINGEVVYECGL